jgi:hypothetical protein
VVHGVTALTRGVRYGLFLCKLPPANATGDKGPQPQVELQYLVRPALEQLQFFSCALQFLEETSDAELADCVREYHHFLKLQSAVSNAGREVAGSRPSFGVEVVWRAHLLSPVAYSTDCMQLHLAGGGARDCGPQQWLVDHRPEAAGLYTVGAEGRDAPGSSGVGDAAMPEAEHAALVAAVRRQQYGFMRQMFDLQTELGANLVKQLAAAVEKYRQFLIAAASAEHELPVPSLQLDLMWHTHMLFPRRYASECVQVAGRLIDHDDSK